MRAEIILLGPDLVNTSAGSVRGTMTQPRQNIAILGAGIMGLSAAFLLSRDEHKITLYDSGGFPADNASFIAGGMLAPYSEIDHMSETFLPACFASIDLWQSIASTLDANTEFQRSQSLIIAHPEDHHSLERFKSYLPTNDKNINHIDLENAAPMLAKFKTALRLQGEASLHPAKTMRAMCDALCSRITLKKENVTPHDIAAHYDHIIDCRGMGAQDDLAALGHDLRGVKGEIVVVRNPDFSLPCPVRLMHPRYPLYIVPRGNHNFMIGASVIETSDSKSASLQSAMELMSALYSLHPSFGDAEIVQIAANIRPSFANNLPQIITDKNIIHCNGLFRHGFLMAPIMADIVTHFIAEKSHEHSHLFLKGNQHDAKRQHGDSHHQRRRKIIPAAA